MGIDDPEGANEFRYNIGWDLTANGTASSWSGVIQVDDIELGYDTAGGGVAIADINGGGLDLILMGIDDSEGPNEFRYNVGWDLGTDGTTDNWSDVIYVDVELGDDTTGGGVAIADIDSNGKPELVLMAIDDDQGINHFRYIVGWDVDASGNVESWSESVMVPGIGDYTAGGDAAVADINHDGSLDLLFMGIDDPEGANEFRYRIGWGINYNIDALVRATPDKTDSDSDGLPDTVENLLGTDPGSSDSDLDELNDYFEARNGLDPLNPDSNNDGLADYLEITSGGVSNVARDLDGDLIPNARDADNDNDGVPDALDISPFSVSDVNNKFNFSVESNGNHIYMDFQVRPNDPDHLRLPMQMWDWPEDDKALMQDLDSSTEDIEIMPMLQLSMTYLPPQEELKEYNIVIAEHKIALKAYNEQYVKVDRSANPDGLFANSVNIEQTAEFDYIDLGNNEIALKASNGCYVAADLSDYPDDIIVVSNTIGSKERFQVERQTDGKIALKASNGKYVRVFGSDPYKLYTSSNEISPNDKFQIIELGGKVLVPLVPVDEYGISANYSFPSLPQDYANTVTLQGRMFFPSSDYYTLADNPIEASLVWMVSGHTDSIYLPSRKAKSTPRLGKYNDGGGTAIADIDNNGFLDLLLMGIDDSEGVNTFNYMIGWNLDTAGCPTGSRGWSDIVAVPGIGDETAGGGAAIANINGDNEGRPDLVLMGIDDSEGENVFRYRVGWDLNSSGIANNWSEVIQVEGIGWETAGGGAAIADINHNGKLDLLLMGIDNPEGANEFRYRVGWDLNSSGIANNWSDVISVEGISPRTAGGGVAIADINGGGLDLILTGIDDLVGANHFRYRIGWDINLDGTNSDWSDVISVEGVGHETAGGGAAIANINQYGGLDLVLMGINDSEGVNEYSYRVGLGIGLNSSPTAGEWSSLIHAQEPYYLYTGGGAAIADINGNEELDLVLMAIDGGLLSDHDQFRYIIGWDVDVSGDVASWSDYREVPGTGAITPGGGCAVADINHNGSPDLLLMGIDSPEGTPEGANAFRYRIAWDLDGDGRTSNWSEVNQVGGLGPNTIGGGVAIADINGGGLDLVLMGINDSEGVNEFCYRIGWNINLDGTNSDWSEVIKVERFSHAIAFGGADLADIDGNGKLDLVLMGINYDEEPNEFRTRIGWNLGTDGTASSWSVPLRNSNICPSDRHGGGAAIADIDGNGKPEMFLMTIVYDDAGTANPSLLYNVVEDIDEGIDEYRMTLAKYYDDFQITGFTVEENYGSDVNLYYQSDPEISIKEMEKTYLILYYTFLNSQNDLSVQMDKLTSSNVTFSRLEGSYSHQDEAAKAITTELIKSALNDMPPDQELPIVFAVTDVYADSSMDDFISGSSYKLGSSYSIDLTDPEAKTTMKTLKMPWYDTSLYLPLNINMIVNKVKSWELEDHEEDMLKFLIVSNAGQMKLTKLGVHETIEELPELYDTLAQLAYVDDFASFAAINIPFLVRISPKIWRFLVYVGIGAEEFLCIISPTFRVFQGMQAAPKGINKLQSTIGHSLSIGKMNKFGTLSRISKGLAVIGFVLDVGLAFYAYSSIVRQYGGADLGISMGRAYLVLGMFYVGALIMINLIPIVGQVITVLVLLSDFLVGVFTGSGWSQRAIEWVIGKVSGYELVSEVGLEIEQTSIDIRDYDDNGLDIGDRIEYNSIVVSSVRRASNLSLSDDEFENSYIRARVRFESSEDEDYKNYFLHPDQPLTASYGSNLRTEKYEIGGWLEPNKAKINMEVPVTFWTNFRIYYEDCGSLGCPNLPYEHTEWNERQSLDTLYFDIMPDNLDSFLNWSAISQIYPDGDGLDNSEEGLQGTDISSWDTDNDGLSDSYEVYFSHTNPTEIDSDGDGLEDGLEMHLGTSANSSDSDGDGLSDGAEYAGWEVTLTHGQQFTMTVWSNPLLADSDTDGFDDFQERERGLNPRSSDSDGDGMTDSYEVVHSTNPLVYNIVPVAEDDSYAVDEDNQLSIEAPGVLENDSGDGDMIATLTANATHGTLTFDNDGSFIYLPGTDFNGCDNFTYRASIDSVESEDAVVTIAVSPVNDAPSFTGSGNQTTPEDAGPQSYMWATMIAAGPENESSQELNFIVTNDSNELFSEQPAISANGTLTYTSAPDANGSANVTVQLHDNGGIENGGQDISPMQSFAITVEPVNDPPVADTGGPYSGNEGSPVSFNGTAYDVDGDTLQYSWDFGDNTTPVSGTLTPSHTYVNDGDYIVTLTVDDSEGGTTANSTTVTVNNLAPVVEAGPDAGSVSGAVCNLTVAFTDAGVLDTHTAMIDWGDGSPLEAGIVSESNGSGTVSGNHVYYVPASYRITVTATDAIDQNSNGSDFTTVNVIPLNADIDFDPDNINLTSSGNWVTVFIELPDGADVNAIDGSTVLLNGVVPAYLGKQGWAKAETEDSNMTDHDGDGIMARMVKFDMEAVKAILAPAEGVVITVSGLAGRITFSGTDTIRVINEGGKGKGSGKNK
ncbi:PKD domain-containing protein [Chloroflexota bacterium]